MKKLKLIVPYVRLIKFYIVATIMTRRADIICC